MNRYAEAIDGTFVYSTDFDAGKAAEAAMAIADEEQESYTEVFREAINKQNRLIAQLASELGAAKTYAEIHELTEMRSYFKWDTEPTRQEQA